MFTAASIHSVADHMTQDETFLLFLCRSATLGCYFTEGNVAINRDGVGIGGRLLFTERYDTAYQTQIASYKSCRVETLNDSERIDERYISDALEGSKAVVLIVMYRQRFITLD